VDQRRMQNAKQLKRDQFIIHISVVYCLKLPFIVIDPADRGDIRNVHLPSKIDGRIRYNTIKLWPIRRFILYPPEPSQWTVP
jgi:hypothetical protein